jgi:hypothetical protein
MTTVSSPGASKAAGVETQAPRRQLARAGLAARLEDVEAGGSGLPEKGFVQHRLVQGVRLGVGYRVA